MVSTDMDRNLLDSDKEEGGILGLDLWLSIKGVGVFLF